MLHTHTLDKPIFTSAPTTCPWHGPEPSHWVSLNSFSLWDRLFAFCPRLVYDRETGKPKGYGFCEYQDQETALSAMRNLNGREFSGRALRVDNAASEKNKEELKSKELIQTTQV